MQRGKIFAPEERGIKKPRPDKVLFARENLSFSGEKQLAGRQTTFLTIKGSGSSRGLPFGGRGERDQGLHLLI